MSDNNNEYRSILGTKGHDTVSLTHAAVANWEHTEWDAGSWQTVQIFWDGVYQAREGNDVIIRDRPGLYRLNNGLNGDAYMMGGEGVDTISYGYYTGAIDIDLSVPGGYGVAKWKGLSGQTIFGDDYLNSIENATGTAFNDVIRGSAGVNTLVGGNGKDEVHGEGGNDKLFGGSHDDRLYGESGNDTIKGDSGNDYAFGGANNDTIEGGSGDDRLYGQDGNDFLYGGTGHNVLLGGDGNDTLLIEGSGLGFGDAGVDVLVGGASADELHGGTGDDTLNGLAGNDEIHGDEGHDKMLGGDGNDKLYGGTGLDVIHGGNGNDTIVGGADRDDLRGDNGNDFLYGSAGLDVINGGNGNDTIVGGANSDTLRGGDGIDTAVWEGFARVVIDVGRASMGTAVQSGFTDNIAGFENFRTGSGNDQIIASAAANVIDSGNGSDWINAKAGNDAVLAGNGNDTVLGGLGNDSVLGGNGDDWLKGEGDNDTLSGGDGEDYVRGGAGTDILFGGNDADQFAFSGGDTGTDSIRDFVLGEDMIRFNDFLADEPEIGESYVGRVLAVDMDDSVALLAMTDDGWQAFAKIVGNGNVAAFNAAIADGSLFNPSLLNGDAPSWFDL